MNVMIFIFSILLSMQVVAQKQSLSPDTEKEYIVVFDNAQVVEQNDISYFASSGELVSDAAKRLIQEINQQEQADNNVKSTLTYIFDLGFLGFSAFLTDDAVASLESNSLVSYVELSKSGSLNASEYASSWGLDRIDQRRLPLNSRYEYEGDGSGVHVYVIDSGIRTTHEEFKGRIGKGYNFVDRNNNANDCHGHGTHVAGIIGGKRYGVAKNVILHPLRVNSNCNYLELEEPGDIADAHVVQAIFWVIQNAEYPAVMNVSLGLSSRAIDDAINKAIDRGIIVVASAGNESRDACLQTPARVPRVITVATSDRYDRRYHTSNYGRCVTLYAPGHNITSAFRFADNDYETGTGSSAAAPHVTGAIAAYISANPHRSTLYAPSDVIREATPNIIRNNISGTPNRLLFTGKDKTPSCSSSPVLNKIYGWCSRCPCSSSSW